MDTKRPVVVVTGFGPFGIHLKNASWEAVSLLPHMNLEEEHDVTLVTKEIPVAYDEVNKIVPELWKKYNPVVIYFCKFSGNQLLFRGLMWFWISVNGSRWSFSYS